MHIDPNWTLGNLLILFIAASQGFATAQSYIVDQSNDIPPVLSQTYSFFAPMGQEFTPNLPYLDVVELWVVDGSWHNLNGMKAESLSVNVREGSLVGPLLGTSYPSSYPVRFDGILRFDMPTTISLLPSHLYVIEISVTGSGNWVGIMSSGRPYSTYPGGRQVVSGLPRENNDLWFREGTVVPEPSTLGILIIGMVLIAYSASMNSKHRKISPN